MEEGIPYKRGKRSKEDMQTLNNALQGDPAALFKFSELYEQGAGGFEKNRELAAKLRYYAAEGRHREAQFKYGEMCEWGDLADKSNKAAEEWYSRAAKQGSFDGMFALGRLFYMNAASSQDLATAEKWLRRAAEGNNTRAQFMLGHMYVNLAGVWLNHADAQEWLDRRADLNGEDLPPRIDMDNFPHFPSPDVLPGETEETEFRTAEELLKGAAAALSSDTEESAAPAPDVAWTINAALEQLEPELAELRAAANEGGSQAPSGGEKPKKFQSAAVRLRALAKLLKPQMLRMALEKKADWKTAAEFRDMVEDNMAAQGGPKTAAAQLNLAAVTILPEVEAECRVEGEKWLCRAAEQGHAKSQYYLGYLYYFDGVFSPHNLATSSKWLHRAAENGHVLAQFEYGLMHKPTPERRSPGKGSGAGTVIWWDWMRRAAEQGCFHAQMNMGARHKDAKSPDWLEACVWYSLAVLMTEGEPDDEGGRKDAIFNKGYCYEQQSNRQADAKARRLHKKLLPGLEKWKREYDQLWGANAKPPTAWWRSSSWPQWPSEEMSGDAAGGREADA